MRHNFYTDTPNSISSIFYLVNNNIHKTYGFSCSELSVAFCCCTMNSELMDAVGKPCEKWLPPTVQLSLKDIVADPTLVQSLTPDFMS